MFEVFFKKADELNRKGEPFAMAVVVRREAPVSGRLGDKAIIQPDGKVFGWIGGGCTLPVIVDEARLAIREGRPRLVRITPRSDGEDRPGVTEYQMECHSGGAVDIFIEPIMPKPQLLILGNSIVARTLARLGRVLDYRVVLVSPNARAEDLPEADQVLASLEDQPVRTANTFGVVSTQGEGDAEMLRQALALDLRYLAFVASRKKSEGIFENLRREGVDSSALETIQVPAGLDIQARTSEEIAVSILAEIIQTLRSQESQVASPELRARGSQDLLITGMSCQHCVASVRSALEGLEGLEVLEVEVGRARVALSQPVELEVISDALERRGYGLTLDRSG